MYTEPMGGVSTGVVWLSLLAIAGVQVACGQGFQSGEGGGGGGATTTSTAQGAGDTGGGSTVGGPCGTPVPPENKPCPAVCDGGCSAGECIILCDQAGECNTLVTCPNGFDCQVSCTGDNTCGGKIECTDIYRCKVICGHAGSCVGADVRCGGEGACELSCTVDGACLGATLECGDGACAARCQANTQPEQHCNKSCDCQGCGR